MPLSKLRNLILYTGGIGITAMVWIAVQGRAVNSAAAYKLSGVPIIGPAVASLRAITNQIYDVTGEG